MGHPAGFLSKMARGCIRLTFHHYEGNFGSMPFWFKMPLVVGRGRRPYEPIPTTQESGVLPECKQ